MAFTKNGVQLSTVYDKDGTAIPLYDPDNYVKYSDGTYRSVSTSYLGTLTQMQAFLVSDSKYYSTNGSNISIQNADFSAVSTKAISTGHGNGFQLGADGKGYISGWDDQSVYVINLSSVTIERTITLPTTGYTTVAVDTTNGLMYIFQRESRPSTEEIYNFIKYDYVNDSILSTVQTPKAFGALQSCDFYDGKVYATYGLGTNVVPCGLDIYNADGSLYAEYTLSLFASTETEGLFVDRSTGKILLSLSDKKVYRLT